MDNNSLRNSSLTTASNKAKEEPVIKPVINGSATVNKKSLGRRFAEIFLPTGIDDIPKYIKTEIVVPAVKKQLRDIAEIFLGPGSLPTSNGGIRVLGSGINYNSISNNKNKPQQTTSTGFSFNDILFDNLASGYDDAKTVLASAQDIIDRYEVLTVNQLYGLCGERNIPHTAANYGWYDLATARIIHHADGWHLIMPKAQPIN